MSDTVTIDGVKYSLGCEMPKYNHLFTEAYGDTQPVYTRQEILEHIKAGRGSMADFVYEILDQNGFPWCWSFSATQALMVLMNLLYGDRTILDPSVGPVVTGVRGGNSIDAVIMEVHTVVGAPTASFTGHDPTNGSVSTRMPEGWKGDAAKRVVPANKWIRTKVADELASAIINKHPGSIGTAAFGGGHAVCCCEVTAEGDTLYFAGPNSWNKKWNSGRMAYPGRAGWWRASERTISDCFGGYGAYVLTYAQNTGVEPAPTPQGG